MRTPWDEKTATWNQPRAGASWAVPGAAGAGTDYESEEDARVTMNWDAGWVAFDVTTRVAKMSVGTSPNNGWRTVWRAGGYNSLALRSSEYTTALDQRPKLEIEWMAAAE